MAAPGIQNVKWTVAIVYLYKNNRRRKKDLRKTVTNFFFKLLAFWEYGLQRLHILSSKYSNIFADSREEEEKIEIMLASKYWKPDRVISEKNRAIENLMILAL